MKLMGEGLRKLARANRALIRETLENREQRIGLANCEHQKRVFILRQDCRKRWQELVLWFHAEMNKEVFRHRQRIRELAV